MPVLAELDDDDAAAAHENGGHATSAMSSLSSAFAEMRALKAQGLLPPRDLSALPPGVLSASGQGGGGGDGAVADDGKARRPTAAGEATGTGRTREEMIAEDERRERERRNAGVAAVLGDALDGGYEKVVEKLKAHPTTRDYVNDPGFLAKVKELLGEDPAGAVRRHVKDPRVMAAVMALNGYDLDVTDEDLTEAEKSGDVMPAAAARATDEETITKSIVSAHTARNAGRLFFAEATTRKAKARRSPRRCLEISAALFRHAAALARDGKWGVEGDDATADLDEMNVGVAPTDAPPRKAPPMSEKRAFVATCLSNAAMALLKLERWEMAKDTANEALEEAGDATGGALSSGDDSPAPILSFARDKAHYRIAKACEALSDLDGAADHMAQAAAHATAGVEAAAAAVRADMTKSALVRRQPYATAEVKKRSADADAVRKEADALAVRRRDRDESRRTRAPDATTAGLRGGGMVLPSRGGRASGASGNAYAAGVTKETDWSHFLRELVEKSFDGACHAFGGGMLRVTGVDWSAYEGHASVQEKQGRRSLFYELDVMLDWVAEGGGTANGKLRLYNVAQDTSYEPGGDPDKSYMYSVGASPQVGSTPFGRSALEACEGLFEAVCERVGGRIVPGLFTR